VLLVPRSQRDGSFALKKILRFTCDSLHLSLRNCNQRDRQNLTALFAGMLAKLNDVFLRIQSIADPNPSNAIPCQPRL